MSIYLETLTSTSGQVNEFVNPKYLEGSGRRQFKAPARLECLMQDIAWSLPERAKVGLVSYPATFGYYPCKNDIAGG